MEISFNNLKGKNCVITGGAGVLGSVICEGLASCGINLAILDLDVDAAQKKAGELSSKYGIKSIGVKADVLNKSSLYDCKKRVLDSLGSIDYLINGAGGNSPKATTKSEQMSLNDLMHPENTFFGLEPEAFEKVFALNFTGTLLPSMVFAEDMLSHRNGVILNISSMNSFRPLTKIPAYSAAKASVNNFTQWLAVHLAKVGIRVNAIAPGFFLTQQNRFLLTDEKTGERTPRGEKILANTPMGRYGDPEDLQGAVLFLLSDMAKFITGVIIPVDGGYSAFGGV